MLKLDNTSPSKKAKMFVSHVKREFVIFDSIQRRILGYISRVESSVAHEVRKAIKSKEALRKARNDIVRLMKPGQIPKKSDIPFLRKLEKSMGIKLVDRVPK
jgi:ERCC4-type nuclease